jgi:hypothetical protein
VATAEEATATATLENAGDEAARVTLVPLSSPSLALEIRTAAGEPVLQPPPPLPSSDPQLAELGPGETRQAEFRGFVPYRTPPGAYRVRFRYVPGAQGAGVFSETLFSDWASFEVVDSPR